MFYIKLNIEIQRGEIMELNIRPSADLRNKYNEISKQYKETSEAEDDVRNGRVESMQESFDDLRESLMDRKNESI